VNTFPQKRFVDISNGVIGLAVLNRGLPEYEPLQQGPGIAEEQAGVALTLLRCVEWLSRGDLPVRKGHAGPMEHTPEAQCLGTHEFEYALIPHVGTWETEGAFVLQEAQRFNIPIATRAIITEEHEGQLPSCTSLLQVEPAELVVSAIKRSNSGHGLIVRVYNPLKQALQATIRPGLAFSHTAMANLLEEPHEQVPIHEQGGERSIHLRISGGSIVTLLFT
jgi:alpha-mannosidase